MQAESFQSLRLAAEEAKVALSHSSEFGIKVGDWHFSLDRSTFDSLVKPLVERTLTCCRQALADAQLKASDIDEVVMVGGSTRIPLVKDEVGRLFGKRVHTEVNPDEVVALGAAIQADILSGKNKDFLLLDITPLSLGIETMGGLMDVLIPRNSKVPTRAGRQYTTQKDGQSAMKIAVYQGERDLVKDNRKLSEFNLTGIPGMPAGLPKVEVSFLIDADGILKVRAKELRSGVEQAIEVKPQYGLTDQEVEQMLQDSITYARQDIATRSFLEARTEAQLLIDTTVKFLEKHKEYLEQAELDETYKAIAVLKEALNGNEKDRIQLLQEKLNEVSRPYAERIMDKAVSAAMKGRKV
jgi:molecular chaperone HscA